MKLLSQDQLKELEPLGDDLPAITGMSGATSADLYLLEYPDRREVLRVFRAERWETPASELTDREMRILGALSDSSLPVPLPIKRLAGNGVVMSWLPGVVDLPEKPATAWLDQLARTLAGIHQLSIELPYEYESWNDSTAGDRPDWWRDNEIWDKAQAISAEPPQYDPSFIHRDYHPVNVLWQKNQISGVVDWINACMGPIGVDVAHCRGNLAVMYGVEVADRFLDLYKAVRPGYVHEPFWDIDDALSALPDVRVYPPWLDFGLTNLTTEVVRMRLEAFVREAVIASPGISSG